MRQFSIISPENSNTNFQFRAYERFQYEKGFKGSGHIHSHTEFFFITEGKGFFHLRDKKVPIHKGMVIIVNSDILHTESSHSDCELAYAVVSLENLMVKPQQANTNEQTIFLDFSADYDIMYDYIKKIEWEWVVREPLWQCALQTHLNSFILYILRRSNMFGIPTVKDNSPNPLANIHLYLTACYAEEISLDKLADMFCINKYYLAHSFKKIYGKTIMHTLNEVRCKTAHHLLQSTNHPIGEISTTVGYNSSSHFTKVYQNFYGETPSETRQNFIKKVK